MNLNTALDHYRATLAGIHAYFNYAENWRVIPLEDSREFFWQLSGTGPGHVRFGECREAILQDDDSLYYQDEIYTQRHLKQWVHETIDFTMIACDTGVDGNKLLRIFDNTKRLP